MLKRYDLHWHLAICKRVVFTVQTEPVAPDVGQRLLETTSRFDRGLRVALA